MREFRNQTRRELREPAGGRTTQFDYLRQDEYRREGILEDERDEFRRDEQRRTGRDEMRRQDGRTEQRYQDREYRQGYQRDQDRFQQDRRFQESRPYQRTPGSEVNDPAGSQMKRESDLPKTPDPQHEFKGTHEKQSSAVESGSEIREPSGAQLPREQSSRDQGRSSSSDETSERAMTALKSDTSLSAAAENVRISRESGKLVLRGSVKSEQEKQQIESKVRESAGNQEIDNQIQVSGSQGEGEPR